MKIGEVIRKYRKEKQMTQEELADYLGITSSAVNKWENGYSLPDITLLAPVARVLGITTDTLLSYREELTKQEISRIMEQFTEKAMAGDYDALFSWAMGILQEYPNSGTLAINILPGLYTYRSILEAPEEYGDRIRKAYQRLLKNQDEEIVRRAAEFLFYGYMGEEKYDEAQKVLSFVPERDSEHRMMLALLHRRRGESDEAYRIYERMILEGYERINWAFSNLFTMDADTGNTRHRDLIMEKQEKLAHLLEMGRYHEVYLRLYPAMEQKDKETSLYLLEEMVQGISNTQNYRESELYSLTEFGEGDVRNTAFLLRQSLGRDETINYLKDDERFGRIMQELERLCEQAI